MELTLFLNGEYDNSRNLDHPNYLRSSLIMPDYYLLR